MKTDVILSNQALPPESRIITAETNRDVIIQHLKSGGESDLTEKQTELLSRWSFCDELQRENIGKLKREQIANMLIGKYKIVRSTAYQDIVNSEIVFCTSTPLNKKYRVQLRIEFLENEIRLASIDNNPGAIAKLEMVLQRYYEMYPDTVEKQSPKTFIFNIQSKAIADSVIEITEAESYLDSKMKEFTEFEEVEDEIKEEDDVNE